MLQPVGLNADDFLKPVTDVDIKVPGVEFDQRTLRDLLCVFQRRLDRRYGVFEASDNQCRAVEFFRA